MKRSGWSTVNALGRAISTLEGDMLDLRFSRRVARQWQAEYATLPGGGSHSLTASGRQEGRTDAVVVQVAGKSIAVAGIAADASQGACGGWRRLAQPCPRLRARPEQAHAGSWQAGKQRQAKPRQGKPTLHSSRQRPSAFFLLLSHSPTPLHGSVCLTVSVAASSPPIAFKQPSRSFPARSSLRTHRNARTPDHAFQSVVHSALDA